MQISQQDYDKLPFAIRQGAIQLWGTPLSSYSQAGQLRRLYSFSDFYAEMCYEHQQLISISTFSTAEGLEPYIENISWMDLLS